MKRLSLIASALAVLGLTACEKTVVSTDRPLVDDEMSSGFGQVKNSLLQVRTRAGGVASDEATIVRKETLSPLPHSDNPDE